MGMRRAVFLFFILLTGTATLCAQDKKEEKVQVYSFDVGGGMDAFSQVTDTSVRLLYFPEFYAPRPSMHNDTTFTYECYDSRDSILHRVKENSEIRFISLFKSYTDPVHSYKDDNGVKKPLPVSSIVHRYDRVGDDKWISVDYATNKYIELREYRNQVVRSDSIITMDPVTHKQLVAIYSYYKVEEIK